MFLFLFISSLLVPISMIVLGRTWGNKPPKDRNGMSGYRTTMSKLNEDTWNYAHAYWGKIGCVSGVVLLVLTVIVLAIIKERVDCETIITYLVFIQLGVFVLTAIPVEVKLHKVFDEKGNRK